MTTARAMVALPLGSYLCGARDMAHKAFISHSSKDFEVADKICRGLERRAVDCWIAPRNITAGADWAESIHEAIASSKVMVLIFSEDANRSPQIIREVTQAVNANLTLFPFRVHDEPYSKALSYFLSTSQWVDALTPPIDDKVEELVSSVSKFLQPAMTPTEALSRLDEMLREGDPLGQLVLGSLRRGSSGRWCITRRGPGPNDTTMICKLCGWSDWTEPGLSVPECCGDCGLESDPGDAKPWFDKVSSYSGAWTGYGDKPTEIVTVKCKSCSRPVEYPYSEGPPFHCPACGHVAAPSP